MAVQVRNGRVDIEVPTDDSARQCARLLKDHSSGPSAIKSIDLRKGVVTSAGAGAIAKALKGERRGGGVLIWVEEMNGCLRVSSSITEQAALLRPMMIV